MPTWRRPGAVRPTRRACLGAAAAALPSAVFATRSRAPMAAMTFNLRVPVDTAPERRWEARLPVAASLLRRHAPDVVGTQETLLRQVGDLIDALPAYGWIGRGRRGGDADEHMAILYRRDRWRVAMQGDFWFSDTPRVPGSMGWGNVYPRMVTWALLAGRGDGRRSYVVNTHLPYRAEDAAVRTRCARMLADWIAALPRGVPVVLTGDFNAAPDEPAHGVLTATLADARVVTAVREGPDATFHDFTGKADRRIDWILCRGLTPRRCATLSDHAGAVWPSDHFPVLAEFE